MPKLIRDIQQGVAPPFLLTYHEEPSVNRAVGVSIAHPLPVLTMAGSVNAVQFIDEDGVPYGIKHIENKPRVSSMPYLFDIAEGNVPGHFALRKFGQNLTVGATMEEIWDGSALYVYLTAAEILQVASGDIDDQGNVVSNGAATGGSTTTLIDNGATFIADGVAVGDIVINDTESVHAFVLTIDSEIQITVTLEFRPPSNAIAAATPFEADDIYRVVNANDTGAAVLNLQGLDGNYDMQTEYIVLNGQTNVVTVNSYLRVFRGIIVYAGASGSNEGLITASNNADTNILLAILGGNNQTLMAIWTVPRGFTGFFTSFYASTSVAKTTAVELCIRPLGETFQIKKTITINQDSQTLPYDTPLPIAERSDICIRASADAGGGIVSAGFDLWYEG